MKKLILSVFALLMVFAISAPNSYAGIPISEKTPITETVIAPTTGSTTVASEASPKVKKVSKKMKRSLRKAAAGGKSQLVALLLCIFVGVLGIHRFYLGYTWQGVVQLLTLGGFFGIWVLIDLIRIIIGDLGPKDGAYDKTL